MNLTVSGRVYLGIAEDDGAPLKNLVGMYETPKEAAEAVIEIGMRECLVVHEETVNVNIIIH